MENFTIQCTQMVRWTMAAGDFNGDGLDDYLFRLSLALLRAF